MNGEDFKKSTAKRIKVSIAELASKMEYILPTAICLTLAVMIENLVGGKDCFCN